MKPPKKSASGPTRLLTAVPELLPAAPIRGGGGGHIFAARIWCQYTRRRGESWGRVPDPQPVDVPDFWGHVASLCAPRDRLTIVAPSGPDLLTVSGYWRAVEAGDWWLSGPHPGYVPAVDADGRAEKHWRAPLILSPKTCITGGRHRRGRMVCYSLTQYADIGTAELVRGFAGPAAAAAAGPPSAELVCRAAGAFMRAAVSDWLARGLGDWQSTAGRLAMSAWRATGRPRNVTGHRCDEAAALEAYACHGGRATTWYVGPVGDRASVPVGVVAPPDDGPHRLPGTRLHHVDCTSLYPWLLGEHVYPDRLRTVYADFPVGDLAGWLTCHCGIARVTIRSDSAEYPVRGTDCTLYPVGEYDTVLAGPELAAAAREGAVVRVHTLLRYGPCRPFVAWRDAMLRWRQDARDAGDHAAEILAKMAANSFGGKFTQRKVRWVDRPEVPAEREWGDWPFFYRCPTCWGILTSGGTLDRRKPPPGCKCVRRRYRGFAGRTQEAMPGKPSHRLPAAVYAYLTAYARQHMRSIRGLLPHKSCVAQDVDGLWLTDDGLLSLAARYDLSKRVPGQPRLTRTVGYARIPDPRRYFAGDRWTVSGVAAGFAVAADLTARGQYIANPVTGTPRAVPVGLTEHVQSLPLGVPDPLHHAGPDGWHVPRPLHRLPDPEPVPECETDPHLWLRPRPSVLRPGPA